MSDQEKTSYPVSILVPLFIFFLYAIPTVVAIGPFVLFNFTTLAKLGFVALAPFTFIATFIFIASLLSLAFQPYIVPGKFPRVVTDKVYGPRRLYGLCWGAIFYFTPLYFLIFSVASLRKLVMWGFGYRGDADVNIAPDAWLRDLPLLKFGKGVYVANKATVGTNMCLSNGHILVDSVTLGNKTMLGHMTMVAPGCHIGNDSEIGVGCAIGLRVSIGDKTRIGPTTTVNHGAQLGNDIDVGTMSYIGIKVRIVDGIKLPGGSNIPEGSEITSQEQVESFISSESHSLLTDRARLEELYSNRARMESPVLKEAL
jgi:carbonic anhydrase/acetyltransferase-like protein (isoleucine patch superfamily)